jgi:hypothetical protein
MGKMLSAVAIASGKTYQSTESTCRL